MRCHWRQYNSSQLSSDWRPVRVSEININSPACSKWFIFASPMFTPATSPKYTRISSMHNLNNDGLITPPWRTTYVFSNSSPSSLFHFTRLLAFAKRLRSYQYKTTRQYWGCTKHLFRLFIIGDVLSDGHLTTIFNAIWIQVQAFSVIKMRLKMLMLVASYSRFNVTLVMKWRPFCSDPNMT